MLIDLPADFPTTAPILLIEPVVAHEWVQPSGQINRPWRGPESSLAQLLVEIKREFGAERGSIGIFSRVDNDSLTRLTEYDSNNSFDRTSASFNGNTNDLFNNPVPTSVSPRAASLPTSPVQSKLLEQDLFLIDQMEASELELLLRDEGAFESFVGSLASFAVDDASLTELEAENYQLASDNLKERLVIKKLVAELEGKHAQYQEALQSYRDMMANSGVAEVTK